jgi:predicted SnoaL-like aldol condensation-catalyzing enzyme
MKTSTLSGSTLVFLLLALQPAAACDVEKMERNKQIVIEFYDAAINQKDFEKASKHLGDKYIQHNPLAADGPEGLKTFLEFAKANLSTYRTDFKRVFADGDYVIVHAHARANPDDPNDRGSAVMDIFRLEGDKVVEHWDVIQAVPEQAMNENTMF